MGKMRQGLLGRRIEHLLALAAVAAYPLAVDIEREIRIHERLTFLMMIDVGREGISTFRYGIHVLPSLDGERRAFRKM
jgi:hypothetical protein